MKFISCHIENFGKLSDFSFEFSEGINAICEENGWGKSTFAAFIRAMFYGLEGERKRSLLENERKKYKPWQGGVFGGQLIFQIQGRQYQISRIFHEKELNDEFELRDARTNLLSKDYSKKIGEEIFQIDRESFLRTVFIGQNECETSSTDDINAKIGNLTDNANNLNNFDAANARLTEIIHALTPSRASGALAKRREEIARCERIFKEGEGLLESMEIYQERVCKQEEAYNTLRSKLLEAGKVQEEASKRQSALAKKSEWMRLKNTEEEKEEEQEAFRRRFPGEIPKLSQVKEQIVLCGELGKAYERMSLYRMGKEEEQEFSYLAGIFESGMPGEEELEAKRREASELLRLKREYDAKQMTEQERERLFELAPCFLDEAEDASFFAADWAERNHKKAALPSHEAAMTALQAAFMAQNRQNIQKMPVKGSIALFVMGILLVAAGIAASVYSLAIGIVIAVLGVGMVFVGARKKAAGAEQNVQEVSQNGSEQTFDSFQENPEIGKLKRIIEEDTAFIERTDAKIAAYLKAHGREFEAGNEHAVTLALQEIVMENAEYQALKKKAQSAKADARAEQLSRYQESIEDFLYRYGVEASQENCMEELYALKERAVSYAALVDKRERFRKAKDDYERNRSRIAAFYEEYGFAPEQNISTQLNDIKDAVDDYEDAVKAWERAVYEREQFEEENDILAFSEAGEAENLPSLAQIHERILALNEEMEQVRAARTGNRNALEDLRAKYDEWEENRVKLEQLRQVQEVQQKKYELVSKAREKLGEAKEAMTAKYAAPILAAFGKYYEMIVERSAKDFHVDANTQVTVEKYGKQREMETLSRGWRDLAGICLRIALADAMYPDEVPALIMDDPFTNLDDEKIAAGKRFLSEVAKKYQIVYFTCSVSRR